MERSLDEGPRCIGVKPFVRNAQGCYLDEWLVRGVG